MTRTHAKGWAGNDESLHPGLNAEAKKPGRVLASWLLDKPADLFVFAFIRVIRGAATFLDHTSK
jgi:hypothetical protein